jgi:hypothetical protein
MTLPASFPLSMSQIAAELGLSLPLSINHSWVVQLAGKGALPVSFSDLLGKTAKFNGNLTGGASGGLFVQFGNAPFFGGALVELDVFLGGGGSSLSISGPPNWNGNIRVTNNTTGISLVLSKLNNTAWTSASNPANLIRSGITDNFSVIPSN